MIASEGNKLTNIRQGGTSVILRGYIFVGEPFCVVLNDKDFTCSSLLIDSNTEFQPAVRVTIGKALIVL